MDNNDMEPGDQNTQQTSPYHIEDYKTQVAYPPPPPQKQSRRWLLLLLLLLLIPLAIIIALITRHPATATVLVPVTATTAPSATTAPPVATTTATITATQPPATTVPILSPQPTGVSSSPTAIPGGATVVTISPATITVACGNATTTVMLTNPSTTQTAHWTTVATGLYSLTPSNGSLPPQSQQKMTISHVSLPGTVVVISSGISQTITITCSAGTLRQNWQGRHDG